VRVKYKTNIRTVVKRLKKSGNTLQIVAADTINESAMLLDRNYQRLLRKKHIVRTKFTLKSVKTYKATMIRKSGEPRPLHDINAIVGIRKMKGGAEHYLAKLEEGGIQKGSKKAKNKVPIPLDTARTSKREDKPIAARNRLLKGEAQTLLLNGRKFGVKNDGFNKNPRQRFAILYKEIRQGNAGVQGDFSKQFYFLDNKNNLGIFRLVGSRVIKIRNLENKSVRRKESRMFKKAVKTQTPAIIRKRFMSNARKEIYKSA